MIVHRNITSTTFLTMMSLATTLLYLLCQDMLEDELDDLHPEVAVLTLDFLACCQVIISVRESIIYMHTHCQVMESFRQPTTLRQRALKRCIQCWHHHWVRPQRKCTSHQQKNPQATLQEIGTVGIEMWQFPRQY